MDPGEEHNKVRLTEGDKRAEQQKATRFVMQSRRRRGEWSNGAAATTCINANGKWQKQYSEEPRKHVQQNKKNIQNKTKLTLAMKLEYTFPQLRRQ